jgi:NitT/TauT family transport system substrate-binding protein
MTGSRTIRRRSVLAAGLASPAVLAFGQGMDKLAVRADFAPWGIQAALHLAEVNGWFKEAGLVVEVQDGRGSGNTLQLVNAGQVDVGQIQVGLIGQARQNGAIVKSFAGFDRRTDLAAIVDVDGPLKTVADFRGKSVVCFAASPWAPFIDAWLKTAGLDRDSVNVMMVDPAALWGTYTQHRADALLSTLPSALPFANTQRASRGVLAEAAGIGFPSYGLIATDATLANRADPLKRLVATQQRAWAHLRDHIQDGVDAMLRQRPDARLDPKVQYEQIRLTLEFFDTPATAGKPIGYQAEADWAAGLRSLEVAGAVKPGWKTADYYTNDFIQAA